MIDRKFVRTLAVAVSVAFASLCIPLHCLAAEGVAYKGPGPARDSRGGSGNPGISLAWDLGFDMNFDNREYTVPLTQSMTVFGARFTPSVGASFETRGGASQRLMIGIDIMKDFGRGADAKPGTDGGQSYGNLDLFREIIMYYRLDTRLGKTDFSLLAGIFPKRFSGFELPEAFVSDSLRFYDNNYEGLLLQFRRPKAEYEVGVDWMGMFGIYERERFMIYSNARAALTPWLSIGYFANMYHYACSATADGVVDNILLNPWAELDFARFIPLQKAAIRLGWYQGAQQDRKNVGEYVFPGGGEASIELRKWNVGLLNTST